MKSIQVQTFIQLEIASEALRTGSNHAKESFSTKRFFPEARTSYKGASLPFKRGYSNRAFEIQGANRGKIRQLKMAASAHQTAEFLILPKVLNAKFNARQLFEGLINCDVSGQSYLAPADTV